MSGFIASAVTDWTDPNLRKLRMKIHPPRNFTLLSNGAIFPRQYPSRVIISISVVGP